MVIEKHMIHIDHPDDEKYDRITIEISQRWKESEISGSEWRFSYVTTAWRKGEAIVTSESNRLEWALQSLQFRINIQPEDGTNFDMEAWNHTKTLCDQPGCNLDPTIFYQRLRPYTRLGEELVDQNWRSEYRQFCDIHKHRGDAGLDDADHNYEAISDPNMDNNL